MCTNENDTIHRAIVGQYEFKFVQICNFYGKFHTHIIITHLLQTFPMNKAKTSVTFLSTLELRNYLLYGVFKSYNIHIHSLIATYCTLYDSNNRIGSSYTQDTFITNFHSTSTLRASSHLLLSYYYITFSTQYIESFTKAVSK